MIRHKSIVLLALTIPKTFENINTNMASVPPLAPGIGIKALIMLIYDVIAMISIKTLNDTWISNAKKQKKEDEAYVKDLEASYKAKIKEMDKEFKEQQSHLTLSGKAELSDTQRTLMADTIVYDGEKNHSTAYGSRPLLSGTSEQGTFAIIADKVESDNAGRQVTLDGKVQGWVVSPQLNDSEINDKF